MIILFFLSGMDAACRLEEIVEALLVHTDEGFVHQVRGCAYSHSLEGKQEALQSGFGRTSSKLHSISMAHAMAEYGPLVTCDEYGFATQEGCFKTKRDRERPCADPLSIRGEPDVHFSQ